MFQNKYQSNGQFYDLFNPRAPPGKIQDLYQLEHMYGNFKVEDEESKSPIFLFSHTNSRISFPHDKKKDLQLTHRYITFQIFLLLDMPWSIELGIKDQMKIKRKIIFSSSIKKTEKKSFYIKYLCLALKSNIWINFTIDLASFVKAFPDQKYKSLDSFEIKGFFKLRRIFTSQQAILSSSKDQKSNLKNCCFPAELQYEDLLVKYQKNISEISSRTNVATRKSSQAINKSIKLPLIESKSKNKVINRQNSKQKYTNQQYLITENKSPSPLANEIQKSSKTNSLRYRLNTISRSEVFGHKKNTISQRSQSQNKENSSSHRKFQLSNHKKKKEAYQLEQIFNAKLLTEGKNKLYIAKTSLDIDRTSYPKKTVFKNNESTNGLLYISFDYMGRMRKFSTLGDSLKSLEKQQGLLSQIISENIEEQSEMKLKQTILQNNELCFGKGITQQDMNEVGVETQANKIKALDPRNLKLDSYEGFGERVVENFMKELERPYSPPVIGSEISFSIHNSFIDAQHKELQLIYDPILDCFYDNKTNTYYGLKNI